MSGAGDLSISQLLTTSWFDSAGIPSLNQNNVLDYFSQRSNPFYDRTCNNEVIKMQRVDPASLVNMTGIEYMLLHVQEPILYIIRKVHRQAPDRVTPLADYYILSGIVYQCPDIWSIINSRLLSTLHLVSEAFTEFVSHSRYDPNRGYYWEFHSDKSSGSQKDTTTTATTTTTTSSSSSQQGPPEDPGEAQRRKVDTLLSDLIKKFPPKAFAKKDGGKPTMVGGEKKPVVDTKQDNIMGAGVKRQGSDAKLPDPKRKRT